eukprot:TRINITY_DN5263_c1_g1_i1.p1 TRINITY_DN5263_c1_g1~~TRINITY_DN5263_c1_g1_i1.p1  ORF type:complete len:520 (-),score=59.90 TRINITY_DN5263_c1_g1_i1:292-1851(-)
MTNPLILKLCANIVEHDFGIVAHEVFKVLVGKKYSLSELLAELNKCESISISRSKVGCTLVGLISHGIILWIEVNGQPKYSFCLQTILARKRVGMYAIEVLEKFGVAGLQILKQLFVFGNVEKQICVTNVLNVCTEVTDRDFLATVFDKMVIQRYIVRHTESNFKNKESPITSHSRKRKLNSETDIDSSLPEHAKAMGLSDNLEPKPKKVKGKRKTFLEQALKQIDSRNLPEKESVTFDVKTRWTLNPSQLDREFRNEIICDYMRIKYKALAAQFVRAMLVLSQQRERDACAIATIPLSAKEIYEAYCVNSPDPQSYETLLKYLMWFNISPNGAVSKVQETSHGGQYQVNIQRILDCVRHETIKSWCCVEFGKFSPRVYDMLLKRPKLFEKQVGEMALLPITEARRLLYHMKSEGVVDMLQIAKKPERKGSDMICLWEVNREKSQDAFISRASKAILNAQLARKSIVSHNICMNESALTERENRLRHKALRSARRLGTVSSRMNESLSLFVAFSSNWQA